MKYSNEIDTLVGICPCANHRRPESIVIIANFPGSGSSRLAEFIRAHSRSGLVRHTLPNCATPHAGLRRDEVLLGHCSADSWGRNSDVSQMEYADPLGDRDDVPSRPRTLPCEHAANWRAPRSPDGLRTQGSAARPTFDNSSVHQGGNCMNEFRCGAIVRRGV